MATKKSKPRASFLSSLKQAIKEERTILAIAALGALFRLWYIHWGLPDLFEEATPLVKSWNMWNWGKSGFAFNPHFFNYPALTFYLNFVVQGIQFILGFAIGMYRNLASYGADMTTIVIPARLLNAAFDVGTIIVLARLVREHFNERAAIAAAVLIALNPLCIEQAHYIIVDTPLTFFTVSSLLFILRIYRTGERSAYLLAGLCIGLAASSKYTGMILLPVAIITHMLRSQNFAKGMRSLRSTPLLLTAIIAIGVFFGTNPYVLLSSDEFYRDFSFEQYHVGYGHLGLDPNQSTLAYYCFDILPGIFGWPLLLAIVGTIVVAIVRKERDVVALLVFPAVYFVMISSWEMRAPRYSLPMVPVLLGVGAAGLVRAWDLICEAAGNKLRSGANSAQQIRIAGAVLIGLVVLLQPTGVVLGRSRLFMNKDTRTIAREWIQKRVKPGAAIATGPYGITIPDSSYATLSIPFLAEESERVSAFYDTRWYEDCDILIASDFDEARYRKEPLRFAALLPYYDTLSARWQRVVEFVPGEDQPGPSFRFYVRPTPTTADAFDTTLFARLETVPESTRISDFLRQLTVILLGKGKFQKAEQVLKNIVSVEPENLEARFTLARVHLTLGENEAALKEVQYIAYRDARRPEVFVFAGDVLMNLNRGTDAEKSFWRAIELDDKYEPAYEDLITYYTNTKQDARLVGTLKRYRALVPKGSKLEKDLSDRIAALEKVKK